jgi:hypothetical protein
MARDECGDCKEHFPGGEGLRDGRCPACLALFEERRAEPEAKPEQAEENKEE